MPFLGWREHDLDCEVSFSLLAHVDSTFQNIL